MGRLGLEPRTTGLTCRTGFHRPPARRAGVAVWTISSPSAEPGRVGGVWPLRALPPWRGCLLIAQSPWIFTVTGTRGSQGVPANSRRRTSDLSTSAPLLKSLALPIELTALPAVYG